ncbi:MAG: hypothetical protein AAF800_14285, partial [Planctomycetota bacterium]
NTSTLFVRQNLTTYLISGRHPSQRKPPNDPGYDPTPLRQELDAATPDAVADALIDHLLGPDTPPARREPARRLLAERSGDENRPVDRDGMIAALCLITAMPEYQLC